MTFDKPIPPPTTPAPNHKPTLRKGVFEPWELEEKTLSAAIAGAERTHLVRQQLWKGTKSDPMSQNSKFGRYTNVLGLIGYERLQIKPLGRVDVGDRRLNMGSNGSDSLAQSNNRSSRTQTIPALLKKIVSEIELVTWVNAEERERLINVFISDLAHRFNHTHDLISSKYTAAHNRRIILKLFEKIGHLKDAILEKCRLRKASMDLLGIFAEEANSSRIISSFRTELNRRINTTEMVQKILLELEGKEVVVDAIVEENEDMFNQQVQEFKDALDSVIHPMPKLEMPKISQKGQQTSVRQKLLMETGSQQTKFEIYNFKGFNRNSPNHNTRLDAAFNEEMFLRNDLDQILAKNKLQSQSGNSVKIGDEGMEITSEDPLLQAHTSASNLVKRQRKGFSCPPIPQDDIEDRYLPDNNYRDIHLKGFDYKVLDEPSLLPKKDNFVYQKQKMPDLTISRTMESRVSMRVPKGFINLSAEPASAVSQFGTEVDTKKIDILDEKLTRYKEIEELYSEITRTLVSNHLETDDVPDTTGCPAAPYDPQIPISNAYKGVLLSYTKSKKPAVQLSTPPPPSPTATQAFATPQIRLTTRLYTTSTVPVDEFSRDRASAMKKITSSRYNTFKYNYGGYTPYKEGKKKKAEVVMDRDDYLDYIRTRTCDFILDLLIDSEEEARAYQAAMEEEANRKIDEEKRRRIKQAEDEHKERRRRRTEYNRGNWNVGALTYMREVQQLDEDELYEDIELDEGKVGSPDIPVVADMSPDVEPPSGFTLEEAQMVEAEVQKERNQPKLAKSKSDTDILSAQQQLEALWVALKMPLDQKLDMAIKYGSKKFGNRLEAAITYWAKASGFILAREELLLEIEIYEREASNPERYFKRGYDGSSEARMIEAKIRDGHLQKLHAMEEKLADVISMIKFELNETVTYQGVPYTEKMKSDYSEILLRHQKQKPLTPLPPIPDE
ncbi:Coiled-coil domain-containing protein 87 [Podochytrium sp. JEL0797]|nr:Coiled-coil domain-containing protein 87 [Podochytrium sp. JEL0797]